MDQQPLPRSQACNRTALAPNQSTGVPPRPGQYAPFFGSVGVLWPAVAKRLLIRLDDRFRPLGNRHAGFQELRSPGRPQAELQAIRMAETREKTQAAFERFVRTYQAKYPKAVDKLLRDREVLLAFYDFPAEHWQHIRSTNPIESTFATIDDDNAFRPHQRYSCVARRKTLQRKISL